MTKLNKIIVFAITAIILIIAVIAILNNKQKNSDIAFVPNTDDKIRYIKAEGCPNEAYESVDNSNINYYMCRSYTTDGEFVYYNGLREVRIAPVPVMDISRNPDGSIASSSLPTSTRPEPGPFVIEGADHATFEIISSDYLAKDVDPKQNPTLTYARDKNSVYREGTRMEGADPDSLVILSHGYIKDKTAVYFRGKKLNGADPETFEFLEHGYSRDKNFVYLTFAGKKLDGYLGASFKILDKNYAKDAQSVYYQKSKIVGADSATFEFIYNTHNHDYGDITYLAGYTKDKARVYHDGKPIDGADPETFILMGQYSKDKNFVYGYNTEKLSWIDAPTFEFARDGYMKDKDSVYFGNGLRVKGADSETFEVLDFGYVKDKEKVWIKRYVSGNETIAYMMQIEGADAETFKTLKDGYARDKNFVYFLHNVLIGADPETFELLEKRYSKDSSSVFFIGTKIIGADPKTFEIIDYTYTKDKNTLYARGNPLLGIDPLTFQILSCGYAKDQSFIFSLTNEDEVKFLDGADTESFQILGDSCYAKDKNSVYFLIGDPIKVNRKILNANPKTFRNMDGGYAKDSNTVYFNAKRIKNADAETFEFISPNTWKDKNSSYMHGAPVSELETIEMISPSPPPLVPVYPIGL